MSTQSERTKAQWRNPEIRARMTAAITEGLRKSNNSEIVSAASKAMWADPERRANLIAKLKAAKDRKRLQSVPQPAAEPKPQRAATYKGRWSDPDFRERVRLGKQEAVEERLALRREKIAEWLKAT